VENFEDENFVSGVSFSSNSGITRYTSGAASGGVTTSGLWGLSTSSAPEPILFNFALGRPARSVGMFFGNDDPTYATGGFTAYLDVYGTSGLLGTIGVQANMNDFVDQFLGVNSASPITSLQLRYGSGFDVSLFHYIDDFQFSIVPEPAGAVATGWILAAVLVFRRPKRPLRAACGELYSGFDPLY
jgi:hypothetical protein